MNNKERILLLLTTALCGEYLEKFGGVLPRPALLDYIPVAEEEAKILLSQYVMENINE